jgi:hypothetical protein
MSFRRIRQGCLYLSKSRISSSEDRRLPCVRILTYFPFQLVTRLTESEIPRSTEYVDRFPEAFSNISTWISEGRIIRKFHVIEGLEKAPESLPLLFSGGNTGKLFVSRSSGPHNLSLIRCTFQSRSRFWS